MPKPFKFVPMDLHGKNKNSPRKVIAFYENGAFCVFPSISDAAILMNVPKPNIIACLKGRLKTAGGYYWKYVDEEVSECPGRPVEKTARSE